MRNVSIVSLMAADRNQQVSRYVIAGAVLLPVGFLLVLLLIQTTLPAVLHSLLILIGGIAVFASTLCGFLAIRQIRTSGGSYYGMRLSVFLSLFFPIIILDLLLFMIGWSILGGITSSTLVPLVWLVVVILADYWIVRFTWNRAIL